MDSATASGLSSILTATKTKILVLSSILGVGTLIYLTKNYLKNGRLLPTWSGTSINAKRVSKRPTIIGGKRHVVIKEDQHSSSSRRLIKRQRSRRSSRRSSFTSTKTNTTLQVLDEAKDINLNHAIADLDQSVAEVEEIFGMKKDCKNMSSKNSKIENELNRLRDLLTFAQNIHTVTEKASNYIFEHQHQVVEDLIDVEEVNHLDASNYNELVESIRNQKNLDDEEYDSDLDSFLSAAESVDTENASPDGMITFERTLKELISKQNKNDYYMYGIEYLTHYGVPVRTLRSETLCCDNDIDFCVKVHCIRGAFKNLFRNDGDREWFVSTGREMLMKLLIKANYDTGPFFTEFDEMIEYCKDIDNWSDIEEELSSRGVCCLNFYDIILDFLIMDSFHDLENPPSAITTALQNRWLSTRFKETALSTAIWTVVKTKKRSLQNPAGFFSRFYDISMHLTPMLAWGFLGPVNELNEICNNFKNAMVGFLCDIFSTDVANYKSVHTLSEDILRLAKKHKESLLSLIT